MKKSMSIGSKISLLILAMVLVSTSIIGVFSYTLYRQDSIKVSADKARSIAETVACAIDGNKFTALIASGEPDSYWQDKKSFVDATYQYTDVSYLYLLDKNYNSHVTYFMEGAVPGAIDIYGLGDTEEVDVHADELFETLKTGDTSITGIYDAEEYGMMVSGFAPILNASGAVVGVVGADINVDDVLASSNFFGMAIIICVVVFSAIFWFFSSKYVKRGIGRPIAGLSAASSKLAKGDMNISLEVHSKDEIGMLTASFIEMIDSTKKQIDVLEHLANGDLTTEITARGESDSMSLAMIKMIDNLDYMFSEIQTSASEVKIGSSQIADGAQVLAQGSTEQAAAVEQLSASISEITLKTDESADLAEQAARLADTIRISAEKGSTQMDEMMEAVNGINQASHDISKVIKVIDDIAFQTNILALNASVEAARAGQHGKGFAVVAEEVRNLAAKSAEAAKNTGGLIANSVEKAELGSRIAGETAASLIQIVAGINESNKVVLNISKSSGEQAQAIAQINKGINQVSQVVQQTSAAAEESAAASNEMSGQSDTLENLISRFKLKNSTALQSPKPQRTLPGKK